RGESDAAKVEPQVREILDDVKRHGDAAVRRYVERFERRSLAALAIRLMDVGAAQALGRLGASERAALELSAERIAAFHRGERGAMFRGTGFRLESGGGSLGLRVRPLEGVGVYAPGGKARYLSSVLMSVIPVRVAGVKEIVLATPLSGTGDDAVL